MAYRRWGALGMLTAVAVLCYSAGASATHVTGLELSFHEYDKYDVCVAYERNLVRDVVAPAPTFDAQAFEVVAMPAQAKAVAAKPEYFLFTENGKAIAEWGRLRS